MVEFAVDRTPYAQAKHILFDPCAGAGEAIDGLRDLWFPKGERVDVEVHAIEMEKKRAEALRQKCWGHSHHGDAFNFKIENPGRAGERASLLYLNPPYDLDKMHGRLEQRFLERWTEALAPGAGILMFVVPHYALDASAVYLATHYQDIRAWRFPADLFGNFKQCVVVGRRREVPAPANDLDERRIRKWAAVAGTMPELTAQETPLYRVKVKHSCLYIKETKIDIPRLVKGFRPWRDSSLVATRRTVRTMIGATYEVALPPRPAHIALALSAGMLNGKRITANRPGLPPLLVKGTFTRFFATSENRYNKDGELVGTIVIQKPRLTLHVLRLDTLEFHQLANGVTPSGAQSISDFNTADLVEQYGDSLGRLMRSQFPAIHDVKNPAHAMDLPRLGREPFEMQAHLISAGLKLLSRGENPMLLAEVGTGKTTVSLSMFGALHPLHFRDTCAELRRLGFDPSGLRPMRRVLVVCPPHLLKSWRDQAAAVLPLLRVVIVEEISDLHRDGDIFVISRETAKLGHGIKAVGSRGEEMGLKTGPRCPRCGADIDMPAEEIAATRAKCGHVSRRPRNRPARIAEALAAALLPSHLYNVHVRRLIRGSSRVLGRSLPEIPEDADARAALPPLDPERLASIIPQVLEMVDVCYTKGGRYDTYKVEAVIHRLSIAAGAQESVSAALRAKAKPFQKKGDEALARGCGRYSEPAFSALHTAEHYGSLSQKILAERPQYGEKDDAIAALEGLIDMGGWRESEPCPEPMFWADPSPRRFPLARYIMKKCRTRFGLLILDEAHEYSNQGTAQQKAAHRLVELPGVPTLALTGSVMGGMAGSLFPNLWALSPAFRRQFRRTEKTAFVTRFGYRKMYVPVDGDAASTVVGYGSRSDREEIRESKEVRQMGEAPGIMPTFILEHLLPTALIMHKSDLENELPPCREVPVPISLDGDDGAKLLGRIFGDAMRKLADQIKKDMYTKEAGKLWGAMCEMPSYLDRCTDDLPQFVAAYPDEGKRKGAVVVEPDMFPAAWVTPKEQWTLDRVREHLADGRNVMIFLRHTGKSGLPKRWLRLFKEKLGQAAVFLDVTKVKAANREDWLNENVIDPGRRILITNPKAVQTGLNNLVHFSRAIWVEGVDYDARVVRQANGRIHRIGQLQDVLIEVPYYDGTVQKTALDLVARKITASVQVDGLDIEGALESAGAGDGDDDSAQAAMSMGEAIYRDWMSQ